MRALAIASLAARAAGYANVIASQAAASQSGPSWFDGLSLWHVPEAAVPASPAVPADAPARDMVFGAGGFAFTVSPVNPASSFAVALEFLDDGGGRVQALAVGGVPVAPRFALPQKTIFRTNFSIPAAAVKAGALAFEFSSLAGPNAILSSFSLSSSNPSDPPVAPVAPPGPPRALPRLTPRPTAVDGAGAAPPIVDLNGAYDFDPSPPAPLLAALRGGRAGAALAAHAFNGTVVVPGEYTLQGYRVASGAPVLYHRAFATPAWAAGLRAKLRFDGVYSGATVYVNGEAAGAHLGGFTPFELDVTDLLAPAPGAANNLTVVVIGETLADMLASGSMYATHDLGGITRKVYLMAAPPVSVADVHVVTIFTDDTRTAAILALNISLANDGAAAAGAPSVVRAALSFTGAPVASGEVTFAALPGGGSVAYAALNLTIARPALWDPEHPRLHDLVLSLETPGAPGETLAMRVGIRDIAVAGNRVLVNGRPIKARGTTRHESHPLVGRALWALEPAGGQWARDIAIFRDINVNYIRTSHYPPAEELMAAADELGMIIEVEMPFCWASGNSGGAAFNYTVQAQREAMVHLRNHASVTLWSLGNESPWLKNFADSLSIYLREVDSTRPFMFDGGDEQPTPPLDVVSHHYPSFAAAAAAANASVPTLFGEYAHLNCYNRREIAADQGLRDVWALGSAFFAHAHSAADTPPAQRT